MTGQPNFVLVPDDKPPLPEPGPLARLITRALTAAANLPALFRDAEPPAPLAHDNGPRLVFAVDATASREPAWQTARQVTDELVKILPGDLAVALAVHGGGRVHTFTEFTRHPATLRDQAAGVTCRAGLTRLVPILSASLKQGNVKVIVYIGDVFEENAAQARRVAESLGANGTKLIVLHDTSASAARGDAVIFWDLARRTGGCVLPFDATSPAKLRDILAAAAVYAVGGVKLLRTLQRDLPGAVALLEHLVKPG